MTPRPKFVRFSLPGFAVFVIIIVECYGNSALLRGLLAVAALFCFHIVLLLVPNG
jgi:hypothetical protein